MDVPEGRSNFYFSATVEQSTPLCATVFPFVGYVTNCLRNQSVTSCKKPFWTSCMKIAQCTVKTVH